MGDVKSNIKPTNEKSKDFFAGVRKLVRPVTSKVSTPADLSLLDLLAATDGRYHELVVAKRRDVENEDSRYNYNAKALVRLELGHQFFNHVIEYFKLIEDLSPTEDFLQTNSSKGGIGSLLRPKKTTNSAQTLIDLVTELSNRIDIYVKTRQKRTVVGPALKVLTYLEVIEIFMQTSIEQLAEVADLADEDSGKKSKN
jgi:hypothetical protein